MSLVKNYFKDWSKYEIGWLAVFTAIILYVGFAFDDTLIGFIASLTGIWCVVLVARGKLENYIFGTVNALAYAYVAYTQDLYGEMSLNLLFYLPIQFIGFYVWSKGKNKNEETSVVKAKKLQPFQWGGLILAVLVFGSVYAYFLSHIGGQQVHVDSFAVVLSVFAQILMVMRYAEQWILWILVNVLSIILWLNVFVDGGESITVLVMWIGFLVNSIYGYIKWLKNAKQGEV